MYEWLKDYTLPGITSITVGAVVLSGWFIRHKIRRYDKHLEDCTLKSINHARLEEKVNGLGDKIDAVKDHVDTRMDDLSGKMDLVIRVMGNN